MIRQRIANPIHAGLNPVTHSKQYLAGVNGSIAVSKTEGRGSNPWRGAKIYEYENIKRTFR